MGIKGKGHTGKKTDGTKLTAKQEKFCYEYVLHLNASKAALNAGYSPKTAPFIGAENLKKPQIAERIKHMQDNLAETAQISALKVIREHQKIAFSSIAHLHQTWIERTDFEELTDEQKACIKSISTKVVKANIGTKDEPEIVDVEYVKIELYDKQKSLDAINSMLGYNAPTKQELTGKNGKDLIPDPITIEIIDNREKVNAEDSDNTDL